MLRHSLLGCALYESLSLACSRYHIATLLDTLLTRVSMMRPGRWATGYFQSMRSIPGHFRLHEEKIGMKDTPMSRSLLFVIEDAFSGLCVEAMERLLPEIQMIVADPSGIDATLAAQRPGTMIWPSQDPLPPATSVKMDKAARTAGAMYLPIVASHRQLLVGPLFGEHYSCASCWHIRQSYVGESIDSSNRSPERTPNRERPSLKPTLANVAISAIVSLIRRDRSLFASPYFVYYPHSRQVRHGTLTSTHECETCRRRLRGIDENNAELRQLALALLQNRVEPTTP